MAATIATTKSLSGVAGSSARRWGSTLSDGLAGLASSFSRARRADRSMLSLTCLFTRRRYHAMASATMANATIQAIILVSMFFIGNSSLSVLDYTPSATAYDGAELAVTALPKPRLSARWPSIPLVIAANGFVLYVENALAKFLASSEQCLKTGLRV